MLQFSTLINYFVGYSVYVLKYLSTFINRLRCFGLKGRKHDRDPELFFLFLENLLYVSRVTEKRG